MKKGWLDRVFIGVFFAIVAIACASILARFFTQKVIVDVFGVRNGVTRAILFDVESETDSVAGPVEKGSVDILAPFYSPPDAQTEPPAPENDAVVNAETADQAQEGPPAAHIGKFERAVRYFEKGVLNWATDRIAAYRTWVSAASGYNKLLGWKATPRRGYNSVVFLRDGFLTTFAGRQDMTARAAAILAIKHLADEQGIDFLFVQYPYKIRESDPESGKLDFSNQNANQRIALLRKGGVPILDLREEWAAHKQEDSDAFRRDVFYRTDQHWRAETGLWATGTIAAAANERFGYAIDLSLFDPNHYAFDRYPDQFLGSYGRQVTLALAAPEDFTLVYPKFETSFDFPLLHAVEEDALTAQQQEELEAIAQKEQALQGSFEMFFDYSMLERNDYYNKVAYFTYVDNPHDLLYIHNNLNHDETSALFLTDSFGRTTVPFFALGVTDTKRIRPDAFDGSWEIYFETEQPDLVVYFEG